MAINADKNYKMLAGSIENNLDEIALMDRCERDWLNFNIIRLLVHLAIMSFVTARLWDFSSIKSAQNLLLRSPKYPGALRFNFEVQPVKVVERPWKGIGSCDVILVDR